MTTSERPRRASGGFTLFEVLASVLILGLVFTILADTAMQGLRSEGTNRRRGEASLLADRRLAELEASLEGGPPLSPGRTEEEVPPYLVTIEVVPLDVMGLVPPPDPDSVAAPPEDGEDAIDSLLAVGPSGESRIQQISVTVEWDEVGTPYQVTRLTFAFDKTGLEDVFPSDEGEGGGEGLADDLVEQLGDDVPPEMQNMIDQLR